MKLEQVGSLGFEKVQRYAQTGSSNRGKQTDKKVSILSIQSRSSGRFDRMLVQCQCL